MLGIVGGAAWYELYFTKTPRILPLLDIFNGFFVKDMPCKKPIPYRLGTFNPEFGISEDFFLKAIADAERVWEKPFKRELFSYAPENTTKNVLKINLTYDYRQQVTEKLATLGANMKTSKASYEDLQSRFLSLKNKYAIMKSEFDLQITIFNQKQQALEEKIKFWNAKGGAPSKEFNKIENERLALETEAKELQGREREINVLADEINLLVVDLKDMATSLNLSVSRYNTTVGVERGETFEEGTYQSDGQKREIDVFEFSNRGKLVRLLTHEFGHALNIEHLDDPKAIMYSLNEGTNAVLSDADLTALETICRTN